MKSLKSKLNKGLAIGLILGISSIYGLGCNSSYDTVKPEPIVYPIQPIPIKPFPFVPLEITSEPIVMGEVNKDYNYQIITSEPSNCEIISGPSWLTIGDNLLSGTPTHISNDEVGKDYINILCKSSYKEDIQDFSLDIIPGIYDDGKLYDWIENENAVYDLDYDGIDDIEIPFVILCETGYCNDLFRSNKILDKINGKYHDLRPKGIKEGLEPLLDIIPIDFISKEDLPLKIHLNKDSTCNNYNFNSSLVGTTINPDTICDYSSNFIEDGKIAPNFKSCLIQDLDYPEFCIRAWEYADPSTKEANGTVVHEASHLFLNSLMLNRLQESFAYVFQCLISGDFGCEDITSFCNLGDSNLPYGSYNYLESLCDKIDYQDLSGYFQRLEEEFYLGDYKLNFPISTKNQKCFIDSTVSEIIGTQTSIYPEFLNLCKDQYPICYMNPIPDSSKFLCSTRISCSSNPLSSDYVDPNYCGE